MHWNGVIVLCIFFLAQNIKAHENDELPDDGIDTDPEKYFSGLEEERPISQILEDSWANWGFDSNPSQASLMSIENLTYNGMAVHPGPENGTFLTELDIIVTKEELEEKIRNQNNPSKRKAISDERYRWTNKIVPYTLGRFAGSEQSLIKAAMSDYHKYTCLKFKQRTNERNYIAILNQGSCASPVGMQGNGQQPVYIGQDCKYRKTITHELGHAIGLQHEQCRPDRDRYIRIHNENIYPQMQYNFYKLDTTRANSYGISYDYGSVMHYFWNAFSMNGRVTMEGLGAKGKKWQKYMGFAPTFSFKDLKLINYIYKCGAKCGNKKCPKDGYLDKNCRCMCKGADWKHPVQPCCKRKK